MSVRTEMRASTEPSVAWSPAIGSLGFSSPEEEGEDGDFLDGLDTSPSAWASLAASAA